MFGRWRNAILLCLVLGVISTIVIAWVCAAFVNPDLVYADFSHTPRADGGDDVIVAQRGFGHTRINRAQCSQLLLDDTGSIRSAAWASGGEQSSETRAGWPFRAFTCSNPSQVSLVIGNSSMSVMRTGFGPNVQGGWEMSPFVAGMPGGAWRAIPLRPIWSGLAIDIIVLGGMWFALIVGFDSLRRTRRCAAGRCEHCGYDLRSGGMEGQRCPECGR